jgi:hypothetical protein
MVKESGRNHPRILTKRIDSTNMKVTMNWIKSTDMVYFNGSQEISTKETIIMMNVKDTAPWNGLI